MSTETVGTKANVSEKQAREVAEAARESGWQRPSFAKELYLGRFDWTLVHPHPRQDAAEAAGGEEFLAKLRAYCESLDGSRIERDALVPDDYLKGFADLGVFGMKIPRHKAAWGCRCCTTARP